MYVQNQLVRIFFALCSKPVHHNQEWFKKSEKHWFLYFPRPRFFAEEGIKRRKIPKTIQLSLLDQWICRARHIATGMYGVL